MGVILKNNAVSTITTAISASDVGLAVAAGTGTLFPTLGASDYFYATLVSAGGTYEVIKVTARVGDTMTIVRAQEGTTAQSFASGSRIELRVTAASITDMIAEHDQASEITFTPTGSISATNVQSAIAEVDSESAKAATLAGSGGAALIGNAPSGTVSATTVQGAINEIVSDLASSTGASLVGANDSSSGSIFTTVQGFITYLRSTLGGAIVGVNDASAGSLFTTLQGFITYLRASTGVAIMSFKQSGTATTRTVDAKLKDAVSLKDYGAVCDGVTSDNAAFTAAVTAGHKRIYIPNGTTIAAGSLTFSAVNGVHFVGDGVQASVITVTGTTGDVVTFSGCQDCGFLDVGFQYASEPTSGWVLKFTGDCFEPFARIRMDYHFNGVWVEQASEARLDLVSRYGFGSFLGVKWGGSASKSCYGGNLVYHGDNPPPIATTTYKAYAGSTAYTLGQVTISNGKVYICTQAGTTGAASSPSTTSGSRFLTDITDGTAKWRFLCRSDATHITQDSNAYSIRVSRSFGLNGAYTFRMIDTVASGSSYPTWAYLGLESDHAAVQGIHLTNGEGVYINDNAWVGSCLSGNGITATSSFRGELHISPTVRVLGNGQHGLLIDAGSVYDIQGLYSGNSQLSAGACHGIATAGTVTDLIIHATAGRTANGGSSPNQGYGVVIGASNDRFIVDGNCSGNLTGSVTGPVASATKVYRNI